MSWLPLLLLVWIVVDIVIVAAIAHLARRRSTAALTGLRAVRPPADTTPARAALRRTAH